MLLYITVIYTYEYYDFDVFSKFELGLLLNATDLAVTSRAHITFNN